uniref:Uncharacterized protein n=1 Tax=Zea mays TaxID=4577 RepID=B6U6T0_MAIZE|nr:hypothetical protein [Zea mays]
MCREACTGARAWCRSTAARASDDASRRAPVHTDTGVGVPAARRYGWRCVRYGWLCLVPLRSTATGDEQKIWDPITETLRRQLASAVRRQYFRLRWEHEPGIRRPCLPGHETERTRRRGRGGGGGRGPEAHAHPTTRTATAWREAWEGLGRLLARRLPGRTHRVPVAPNHWQLVFLLPRQTKRPSSS